MAIGYWLPTAVAVIAVVITCCSWFLAEVFPFQQLRAHREGKPTVLTDSYAGRSVLITGAHGAYGSRVAKIVARKKAGTLVLIDVQDCTPLKNEIEAELGPSETPEILVWQVDMMSFASCQELGEKIRNLKCLDHALLTAGILSFNRRESPEGWETSIQVNYLSTALLALLILPALKSSPSNPSPPVLTFVTSFGIYPASPMMLPPWSGSYLKHLSNNWEITQPQQYGKSKILLLYFGRELAARITAAQAKGKGAVAVTVNSADPGPAWTPLTAPNQAKLIPRLIQNFGSRDPQYGAAALANGMSVGAEGHGKVLTDELKDIRSPPFMERSSGRRKQQRVWEETRQELEAKVPDVKTIYALLDHA